MEATEDPAAFRQLFGVDIPDMVALRLGLLPIFVVARDEGLYPKISADLVTMSAIREKRTEAKPYLFHGEFVLRIPLFSELYGC